MSRQPCDAGSSSARSLGALSTLVFVVVFNFFLFRVVNDDPVNSMFRGRNLTPEQLDATARDSSTSTAASGTSSSPTCSQLLHGDLGLSMKSSPAGARR